VTKKNFRLCFIFLFASEVRFLNSSLSFARLSNRRITDKLESNWLIFASSSTLAKFAFRIWSIF